MTDDEMEKITGVFKAALDVSFKSHEKREAEHFQVQTQDILNKMPEIAYVRRLIKKDERRAEMWRKIEGNFIFYLLTGVTATIGWAVWEFFVARAGQH